MGSGLVTGALAALALAASAAPAAADCKLERIVELPVTMQGPRPVVTGRINGQDVRLFADSGGFFSMLTPGAVARLGLKAGAAPFGLRVKGATGEAQVRAVTVKEFSFQNIPIRNIDFLVAGEDEAGLDGTLGQNVLSGVDAEFDFANGAIRLFRTEGCGGRPLAYWDKTGTWSELSYLPPDHNDRQVDGTAYVNGVRIRVIFDTGSPRSVLSLDAARRAGVTRDDPGAVAAGFTTGIGGRPVDTWIAPVQSFKLGQEEIRNTRLRIGDIDLDGADMLLGADFFLSHHIFVARGQRKIYFTYNGGPVFLLDRAGGTGPPPAPAPAPAPAVAPPPGQAAAAPDETEPHDAASFGRRAAAFASRGELQRALQDYDRAIALDPKDAGLRLERAQARARAGQAVPAMDDLNQALQLDPSNAQAHIGRGAMRLASHDARGAAADFDAADKLDPMARLEAGGVYLNAGLFRDAVGQYDAWTLAHPKDPRMGEVLNARCWARALGGLELDKALDDCDAALKLRRASDVLDSRGLVRLRLGQYDQAIADYDAALKLQPKGAWSLYGRGLAEVRKGLKTQGEADMTAAAALAPRVPALAKRAGLQP
jgi:tetratricopeptide (TPR) repeat protein/predicted aspartyl protease